MGQDYHNVGGYQSGMWLVAFPNHSAGLYGKAQLPKPDNKIQYYWLGGKQSQANDRLPTAIATLAPYTEQIPDITQKVWNQVMAGKPLGIAGNLPISPGTSVPKPPGTAPGATYQGGPLQDWADAITSVVDFLKLIAWLFAPQNLLRAVEFLVGIVLMGFGLWAAVQARGERGEGFTTGESAISRSGLGRVSRELAAATGERRRRSGRSGGGGRVAKARTAAKSVRPAPHRTRRTALRVRYERERQVSLRQEAKRRSR